MSKIITFLNQLKVEVLTDSTFILTDDFYVLLDCERELVIPEGFTTDFASVPRLPLVYLAVGNKGHKAAVLHDWLYAKAFLSREQCDAYFYHALRESGVNYLYAQAMYRAVRLAGGSHYGTR